MQCVVISIDGLLAVEITTDKVNGEIFLDFLRGSLIPEIIMNNCSIHRVQEVTDLLNTAGILKIFLPPYSPDYNPIELTFSYIKYYLKQHEDIIHTIPPIHFSF